MANGYDSGISWHRRYLDRAPHMDPRATDTVFPYLVPYPVAALYRLATSSHDPSARMGFSLRLTKGVIRFLALVNFANAAVVGAERARMQS